MLADILVVAGTPRFTIPTSYPKDRASKSTIRTRALNDVNTVPTSCPAYPPGIRSACPGLLSMAWSWTYQRCIGSNLVNCESCLE